MGIVVFGFSVAVLIKGGTVNDLLEASGENVSINIYTSAAIMLIVISAFVIVITFFGCCGAIKVILILNFLCEK